MGGDDEYAYVEPIQARSSARNNILPPVRSAAAAKTTMALAQDMAVITKSITDTPGATPSEVTGTVSISMDKNIYSASLAEARGNVEESQEFLNDLKACTENLINSEIIF
jgi:inosine/xanthosine triphosphate pyrophosphatase family protein